MEIVEEPVLAGIEPSNDDEGGHAGTEHFLLTQFDALELDRIGAGVAQFQLEAGAGRNLEDGRPDRAASEFDDEDRVFVRAGGGGGEAARRAIGITRTKKGMAVSGCRRSCRRLA